MGINGGTTPGGTSWLAELLLGVPVIIHFLFHVDFNATSGTESKAGF